MRKVIRSTRKLSAKKLRELRKVRDQIEHEDLPALMAQGRVFKARHELLRHAVTELRAERLRQGLTLEQVSDRCGIGAANLGRLETAKHPNPTIATLMRYAHALGKDMLITLGDRKAG